MNKPINLKTKNLPVKPGVYIFKDNKSQVIYVGKAKNLKKRVSSYFQKGRDINPDKLVMISKIHDIDCIITDTEAEAIFLEANLVKKHQPQFNIILRDDKNFLYIKLNLQEEWPRVELVRKPTVVNKSNKNNKRNKLINAIKASRSERNKSKFFGPYASADSARRTYKIITRIFKICTCKNFTKRPCLKYHLGWCLCPAETKIGNLEYHKIFAQVAKFLKGQTSEVLCELKSEMKKAASQKKYEEAARLRDQIKAIEVTTAKQKIISLKNENYDVISLARSSPPVLGGDARGGEVAATNLFIIREGKLINKLNFLLEHTQNSSDAEILKSFVSQYYPSTTDVPREIIVPKKISIINYQLSNSSKAEGPIISSPSRGKKRKLVALGTQNAQDYLHQQSNIQAIQASSNQKALSELKKLLHLPQTPRRIEAYDISNIQGQNATGSMVVFTNGQPDKSEYRKFKIRTISGANDVAMLAEVVSRRLKNPGWPKPDLIVLDGGKPQLNAILKIDAIKLSIIALAKKEEQLFLPMHSQPVILPKSSPGLQLLQRVRDEAHRFARNYYLKRQKKESIHSKLDDIPGIGPKTKKKLLEKFSSVEEIKKATFDELSKVANKKVTEKIKELL